VRFARALCSSPDGHRTAFAKSFTQLPGHQLPGTLDQGRPSTGDRACVFRLSLLLQGGACVLPNRAGPAARRVRTVGCAGWRTSLASPSTPTATTPAGSRSRIQAPKHGSGIQLMCLTDDTVTTTRTPRPPAPDVTPPRGPRERPWRPRRPPASPTPAPTATPAATRPSTRTRAASRCLRRASRPDNLSTSEPPAPA
jgi:hypothetical protein